MTIPPGLKAPDVDDKDHDLDLIGRLSLFFLMTSAI
jgi:hypothetical protein